MTVTARVFKLIFLVITMIFISKIEVFMRVFCFSFHIKVIRSPAFLLDIMAILTKTDITVAGTDLLKIV